jgi:hypothetical protein
MINLLLILWSFLGLIIFVYIAQNFEREDVSNNLFRFFIFGISCGLFTSFLLLVLIMIFGFEYLLKKFEPKIKKWIIYEKEL